MKNGILVLMLTVFATGHASQMYKNGIYLSPISLKDRMFISDLLISCGKNNLNLELVHIANGSELPIYINEGNYKLLKKIFLRESKGTFYIQKTINEEISRLRDSKVNPKIVEISIR